MPPTSLRRPLQALLFVVLGVSMCGDQIAAVALLFRMVDARQPGIAVAVLFGALVVPRVVVGPFAGVLVDRYDTRRVLTIVVALQALVAVGLAVTTSVVLSIAGAYVLGTLGTVVNAAVFALIPTILGRDRVLAANSYYELAMSFSSSAGPVLGGALVAWWGGRAALLIDAATFAAVIPVVLAARLERPAAVSEPDRPRWFADASLGLRLLLADRVIRRTMMVVVTGVVATSAIDVALVYFVEHYLHAGKLGYGIMLGLWGAGMVIGSLLAAGSVKPKREYAWLVGGIAVIGLAILVAGVKPNVVVFAVSSLVGGVANALFNIASRSLVHNRIDPRYHGRVGAARLALISVAVAFGFALGGVFGPSASRTVYIVAGLVTVAATAIGWRLHLDNTVAQDEDSSVARSAS